MSDVGLPGRGKPNGIVVVFDYPSPLNWNMKAHLWGIEKDLFMQTFLAAGGLPETPMYWTYAVKHRIPSPERPTSEHIRRNHRDLLEEITAQNPQKILLVGRVAFSVFYNTHQIVNLTDYRGRGQWATLLDGRQVYTVTTIPPYFVTGDPDVYRDFAKDITKLVSKNNPHPTPTVERYVCETPEDVVRNLHRLHSASALACDIETTGLNPREDIIDAIGFSAIRADRNSSITVVIPQSLLYEPSSQQRIYDFLTGQTFQGIFVFHNSKFDLKFLTTLFGVTLRKMRVRDTMLMNYLLDDRQLSHSSRPHGLKALSRVRYDAEDFKFDFETFWSLPREKRDYTPLYHYLGLDLTYTIKLYWDLLEELQAESPGLLRVLDTILVPATQSFVEIELHGIMIDRQYLENTSEELGDLQGSLLSKCKQILLDLGVDPAFANDFNPNSHVQVKDALFRYLNLRPKKTSKGIPSTDKESLHELAKAHAGSAVDEFIQAISKYREISKARSTYVHGLLESATEAQDRIHAEFNVCGTSTGRLSSSKPNLQNIPTLMGPIIRKAFIAPKGFIFAEVDYSQLELRVAGLLSKDPMIMKAYVDGRDIHKEVAAAAFNVAYDEVTYDQRYAAKYIDFGVIYGRTAASLAVGPELIDYGWSTPQAQKFIDDFLGQFSKLREWMNGQKDFALENGYVETPNGRRRRWPLIIPSNAESIQRQAVNTPIQGLASDFTVTALIRIHDLLYRYQFRSKIVSTVHDSILFEIHEDEVDVVCSLIQRVMTTTFPVPCDIPIRVDVEVGPNWGDLEEWEPIDLGRQYWWHPESESWFEHPAQVSDSLFQECMGPMSLPELLDLLLSQ